MYEVKEFSDDLDLTEFYQTAKLRGFENNSSKEVLYDTFAHLDRYNVWLLYYNNKAIGSVAAHSLEELGILGDAYRIAARTCFFTGMDNRNHNLRTLNQIKTHNSVTPQFLIPPCIEWAGRDKKLFISSTESSVGTQRWVHNIYCPALNKTGALHDPIELDYRGSFHWFWQLNVDVFYEQLVDNWWPESKNLFGNQLASYLKTD